MERKLHLWLWHLDIPSAPFLEDVWILQIFLHSENDARGIHSGWEDIANPICQGADVNSRDAFVPPKPKEFDKAAPIGISFEAVKGMKASLNTGSGFERFSVSGAIPCNKTGKQQIKKKGHCHWCRQFFSNTNPLICSHDAITEIHKQLICLLQSKWETGPVVLSRLFKSSYLFWMLAQLGKVRYMTFPWTFKTIYYQSAIFSVDICFHLNHQSNNLHGVWPKQKILLQQLQLHQGDDQ